jgi:hypothetical protein
VQAPLTERDFATRWVRLPLPGSAASGQIESLIETEAGFAALYRDQLGQGKVVGGWDNRVLLSEDGVAWVEHGVLLGEPGQFYRALAYGLGRYVLVGSRYQEGAIAASSDGIAWTPVSAGTSPLLAVEFLNGRFFALSLQQGIWSSTDGVTWRASTTQALQLEDAAYGDGVYVAVGSGPFEVSSDGVTWRSVSMNCAIAGNCVQDPSGGWHQAPKNAIFFADGAFYADNFISTDKGASWRQIPQGTSVPHGFHGGYFLRLEADRSLSAWRTGDHLQRVSLEQTNPPGRNCRNSRCFIVGNQLFLIP